MTLTPTEKYLKPHGIFQEKTFEEYCSRIPEFYFKKEVHEDVIKNFEIVEQLLAHSYYEYRFIDEAYAKALHTFEMAMYIRLRDFQPNTKIRTFKPLTSKLLKLKLFDTGVETLNHLEFMRNHYSHPKRHNFAGIVIWNKIEFISRLINELYEDVPLRSERNRLEKEFNNQLRNRGLTKGLVMKIKSTLTVLFSIQLLFINNKRTPPTYLFACTPLFDLEEREGSIKVPFVFKSNLVAPLFANDILEGQSFSGKQKVVLSPISHYPQLLPVFETWNSEYSKKNNKVLYEFSNPHIPNIFIPEIQEFQRM
jgi:hypothetical protein